MDLILFLTTSPFFVLGNYLWSWLMGMTFGALAETPDTFSSGAWNYIANSIYPITLSVGTILLNLAFMVGMFRQASDLKQNLTLEIFLGLAVKLLFANVLMQGGIGIMRGLFQSAAAFTTEIGATASITTLPDDIDAGMTIFGCVFGIFYFLVCAVCGGLIFLSVYGRFLQLYVMAACAPLALPFLAGGPGAERSGGAFIRSFLGKCFEIVVIALFLEVGMKLCRSIDWLELEGIGGWFDGAAQCLQNMVTMILMAASVKGADSFMRRIFGL